MISVNQWMVMHLLDPLAGGADDDAEMMRYSELSPDDEAAYRSVIRERLKPHFEGLPERVRSECKSSVRYFLNKPSTPFDRFMDCNLLPFPPPREPRQFFVWLWEEFIGPEGYVLEDLTSYREVNDITRPIMVRLVRPRD